MSQGNGSGSGRGEWAGISILGVVLIVIGAIFLVDQLGIFQFAWRVFWPILLIVIGVVVVVRAAGRKGHDGRARTSGTNASVVARDGAARLELELGAGGGTFRLAGGSTELVEVHSSSTDVAVQERRQGDLAQVRLRQDVASLGGWRGDTSWDIRTASDIPTQLRVDGGAANFELDLSAISIVDARLQVGAARARVVLPRPQGRVTVAITAGAASVTIEVPDGVEYRFEPSGGLNSVNGRTESPGFDAASERVLIRFTGGAASVRIG